MIYTSENYNMVTRLMIFPQASKGNQRKEIAFITRFDLTHQMSVPDTRGTDC